MAAEVSKPSNPFEHIRVPLNLSFGEVSDLLDMMGIENYVVRVLSNFMIVQSFEMESGGELIVRRWVVDRSPDKFNNITVNKSVYEPTLDE